jgi:cell division protein FtsQ
MEEQERYSQIKRKRKPQEGSKVTSLDGDKAGTFRPSERPARKSSSSSSYKPTFSHPRYPRINAGEPSTRDAKRIRMERLEQASRKQNPSVRLTATVATGSSVIRGFWYSILGDFKNGKIPAFIAFIVILGFGYWLFTAPNFKVTQVNVKGSKYLDAKMVMNLTAVDQQNFFLLDEKTVTQKLKALSYVTDVTVSKNFPNQITVDVSERTWKANWKVGNNNYMVDRDGVVLETFTKVPDLAAALPVINSLDNKPLKIGDKVDAVAVISADPIYQKMSIAGYQIASLDYTPQGGLIMVTKPVTLNNKTQSYKVMLGSSADIDRKVAILKGMFATPNLNWSYADLRFTDKPAVT